MMPVLFSAPTFIITDLKKALAVFGLMFIRPAMPRMPLGTMEREHIKPNYADSITMAEGFLLICVLMKSEAFMPSNERRLCRPPYVSRTEGSRRASPGPNNAV
jgi:hypothetical protein